MYDVCFVCVSVSVYVCMYDVYVLLICKQGNVQATKTSSKSINGCANVVNFYVMLFVSVQLHTVAAYLTKHINYSFLYAHTHSHMHMQKHTDSHTL